MWIGVTTWHEVSQPEPGRRRLHLDVPVGNAKPGTVLELTITDQVFVVVDDSQFARWSCTDPAGSSTLTCVLDGNEAAPTTFAVDVIVDPTAFLVATVTVPPGYVDPEPSNDTVGSSLS